MKFNMDSVIQIVQIVILFGAIKECITVNVTLYWTRLDSSRLFDGTKRRVYYRNEDVIFDERLQSEIHLIKHNLSETVFMHKNEMVTRMPSGFFSTFEVDGVHPRKAQMENESAIDLPTMFARPEVFYNEWAALKTTSSNNTSLRINQ